MTELRSLAETAGFFGVSQPTLKRWIENGCPVAEKGSNGVAYKLDLRAVATWRSDQRAAEDAADSLRSERDAQLRLELLGDDALTAQPDSAHLSPKQRADALAAEVARTKLAQLRRELVPAEAMALALSDLLATVKTRIRQLPDVLAGELGLSESQSARAAEVIDEILNDAADALEKMTDGAEAAAS